MRRRTLAATTCIALAPLAFGTQALAGSSSAGSTTGGDPYIPLAGNDGNDGPELDDEPATGQLDGTATATYDRGLAALHALRVKIDDRSFFCLLKDWTSENAGGNVSTADLVTLAERLSGQGLNRSCQTWIDDTNKPATW